MEEPIMVQADQREEPLLLMDSKYIISGRSEPYGPYLIVNGFAQR